MIPESVLSSAYVYKNAYAVTCYNFSKNYLQI